jgi:hypothetical protein
MYQGNAVIPRAIGARILAGDQRVPAWHAEGILIPGRVVANALDGEFIQVRRLSVVIAIISQRIPAHHVRGNE